MKSSRRLSARHFVASPGSHRGTQLGRCGLCPFVCLGSAPVQVRYQGERQFKIHGHALPSLQPQLRDTSRSGALQKSKAKLDGQALLWQLSQCCKVPKLDCRLRLSARFDPSNSTTKRSRSFSRKTNCS